MCVRACGIGKKFNGGKTFLGGGGGGDVYWEGKFPGRPPSV